MNFEMTRSQKHTLKLNRKFLDKNVKPGQGPKTSTEVDGIKKLKKEDEGVDTTASTLNSKKQVKMDIAEVKTCAECLKLKENTNAMKVFKYVLETSDSEGSSPINELLNIPKLKSKVGGG